MASKMATIFLFGVLLTAVSANSYLYDELKCEDSETLDTCPSPCFDDFCPTSDVKNDICSLLDPSPDYCGEPVCRCRFNYKRNDFNGTCIPTRDCPPFDCFGPNEEYNSCPPLCSDDCSHATASGRCPTFGRIGIVLQCKPTCRCKAGYWRKDGICVPYAECQASQKQKYLQCPVNEVFAKCTDAVCWKTCKHLATQQACIAIADCDKPGCVCQKGYFRNNRGVCVPANQCFAPRAVPYNIPQCPANEKPVKCTDAVCVTDCEHLRSKPYCIAIADCDKPGCVCADGFLRNAQGICVPSDTCPQANPIPMSPQCPVNEAFSTCTDAVCWKTCDHLITKPPCASIADCNKPGCVCQEGYLRNKKGVCVPIDNCPAPRPVPYVPQCPANEKPVKCTDAVCVTDCEHLRSKPYCIAIADCDKPGCVCTDGYLRDGRGICVPSDTCPHELKCEDSETLDTCPSPCFDDFCPTSDVKNDICSLLDPSPDYCGEPVCRCRFNYKRNNFNGTCIPTRDCPPFDCFGPNEEYNSCPPLCSDDCSHATASGRCPTFGRIGIVLQCKPTCRCKAGYWRKDGICVPYAECQASQEPKYLQCPVNEVFSKCTDAVCWKTCKHLATQPACIAEADCDKPGCVCQKGYFRNNRGVCVPANQCFAPRAVPYNIPQCPANEKPVKCTDAVCVTDCEHLRSKPYCIAIADCDKPGCVCADGFLRNAQGICVPSDTCPQANPIPMSPQCPVNEAFSTCTDAVCWKTCDHLITKPPCASIADCNKPGCVCQEGYLRNKKGVCVPTDNCPAPPSEPDVPQCPYNEIPVKCTDAVCVKDCEHLRSKPYCIAIADCDKPGCVCTDGYLRNAWGICVPSDTCPQANPIPKSPLCPINEVFSKCTDAVCWKTCDHWITKPACIAIADCDKPGCVCQKGYFRNNRGVCVPSNSCNAPRTVPYLPQCPVNEKPVKCTDAVCVTDCEHLRSKPYCIAIADCDKPGCVCADGYLRDGRGICVPSDTCPQQCQGANEFFSCGSACDNVCTDLALQNRTNCPIVNIQCNRKCYCEDGFARDNNNNCVPIEDCPNNALKCGYNEEASNCKITCPPQTCASIYSHYACGNNTKCEHGCNCRDGYLRNSSGICIPSENCNLNPSIPETFECPANEVFSKCTDAVCWKTCAHLITKPVCIAIADCDKPGCVCQKGYLRNKKGVCVPTSSCRVRPRVPARKCRKNEVFVKCADAVCWKTCKHLKTKPSCIAIADCDKPACVCRKGFLRNRRGVCIPKQRCFVRSNHCKKPSLPRWLSRRY